MNGRRLARFLACIAIVLPAYAVADDTLEGAFPESSIVISASGGACYRFDVYVAETGAQWRRGLMHVRHLEARTGMLFVYRDDAVRSMWMKNTLIPLDMLFIFENGVIESIATDTEPLSLASVASGEPVRYVLELNAGTTARLGIRAGDEMYWAGDITPPASEN
ncbi:MAG: DUF192 domain-containing protein [Woeseia sp.]